MGLALLKQLLKMSKKILGVDLGQKRIGLAEYLSELDIILPLNNISSNNYSNEDLLNLLDISKKYDKVVFGMPLDNLGNLHDRYANVSHFIESFKNEYENETIIINEHKTTIQARTKLKNAGLKESKIKKIIDSNSAVEILERYVRERSK
jgi:putative transcription antitermination factor YqgF